VLAAAVALHRRSGAHVCAIFLAPLRALVEETRHVAETLFQLREERGEVVVLIGQRADSAPGDSAYHHSPGQAWLRRLCALSARERQFWRAPALLLATPESWILHGEVLSEGFAAVNQDQGGSLQLLLVLDEAHLYAEVLEEARPFLQPTGRNCRRR